LIIKQMLEIVTINNGAGRGRGTPVAVYYIILRLDTYQVGLETTAALNRQKRA